MKLHFGRNIYGLGAIAFGIITLFWHNISALGDLTHPEILTYIAGTVELIAGLAIQWKKTTKFGALTLIVVYFIFTLFLMPPIIEMPLTYFNWGNFFEQFSVVLGGVIVLATTLQSHPVIASKLEKVAYRSYGICVISYSLYQLFYLSYTASLVPKWIPPNQMFWAVATSLAFALAAYAVISGRSALLAVKLLTITFICFGLLIWLPASFFNPYQLRYWVSNAQNLAVAGSAWVFADFLSQQNINTLRWSFGRIRLEQSGGLEQ